MDEQNKGLAERLEKIRRPLVEATDKLERRFTLIEKRIGRIERKLFDPR